MAKMQIFAANADGESALNIRNAVLAGHGGTLANFMETGGNDDKLVLRGKDFYYEDGVLVGGTVTSMTTYTSTGAKLSSVTGLHLDVEDLQPQDGLFWAYFSLPAGMTGKNQLIGSAGGDFLSGFDGKDTIKGLGGADFLVGGGRVDRLSGGGGADVFLFFAGFGHDVITDFQSDGTDVSKHDQIQLENLDYEVRKDGRDVIIETSTGETIRLLDFRKGDLDPEDIISVI
jgi:Ca2+-binding RTX toxin-like protein